ncbi:hypothetical protein C8Q78DRAFT_1014830 [Trametes maxima]|nr:hypothetical protein C8Q78DRAFT_1014830 [Trametes maxima]
MRPSTSLVTAVCLPLASALSWTHAPFWRGHVPREAHVISADGSVSEEVALIVQGSDTLDKYATKPDCFRKASSFIRVTCGELEHREDERVKAALFMTLCEIATAETHSPPMECIPYQLTRGAPHVHHIGSSHGQCVEALSRSAQYWSSYSGYLREVPQLCFAFRRWSDIDTAKDLHRNSTVQSLALLRHLDNREKVFERALNRSNALIEGMHAVLDQLHTSSVAINGVPDIVSQQLRLTLSEMNHVFRESFMIMQEGLAQKHSTDLIKIESNVVQALSDLQMATSAVAPAFRDLLTHSLQGVYTTLDLKLQSINALVDQVSTRVVDFGRDFEVLHRDTRLLIGDTKRAGDALAENLRDTFVAHQKQLEVVQKADDVALALDRLVVRAHVEMENINGTAAAMKKSILKDISSGWGFSIWSWLEATMIYCLKYIWQEDPIFLDHPAFRATCLLFHVLWSLFGFLASGLVSALVLLTSRGTLLAGPPKTEQPDGDTYRTPLDTRAPRVRCLDTVATKPSSPDCAVTDLLGANHCLASTAAPAYHRPRPRISRIPNRLCNSIGI